MTEDAVPQPGEIFWGPQPGDVKPTPFVGIVNDDGGYTTLRDWEGRACWGRWLRPPSTDNWAAQLIPHDHPDYEWAVTYMATRALTGAKL